MPTEDRLQIFHRSFLTRPAGFTFRLSSRQLSLTRTGTAARPCIAAAKYFERQFQKSPARLAAARAGAEHRYGGVLLVVGHGGGQNHRRRRQALAGPAAGRLVEVRGSRATELVTAKTRRLPNGGRFGTGDCRGDFCR